MVLCVWFLLVVNTSASDCLERLVPEMIYCVSRGTLNYSLTHSLTHSVDNVGAAAGRNVASSADGPSVLLSSRPRMFLTVLY